MLSVQEEGSDWGSSQCAGGSLRLQELSVYRWEVSDCDTGSRLLVFFQFQTIPFVLCYSDIICVCNCLCVKVMALTK